MSIEDAIGIAIKNGFDGIELRGLPGQHLSPEDNDAYKARVRKLICSSGLSVPVIAAYSRFGASDKEELEKNALHLLSFCRLAADFEIPFVRTFIGNPAEGLSAEDVLRNTAGVLSMIGNEIRGSGVMVLIELHDNFSTAGSLMPLMQRTDESVVGILWDSAHSYRAGEAPEKTASLFGNRIKHIHIKDYVYDDSKEGYHYVSTGTGQVPIREIIKSAQGFGFEGFFSLEWEKAWHNYLCDMELEAPKYIKVMKSLEKGEI